MEGDLAVGFPPAVRLPLATSRMAGTTDRSRIVIHHLAKSLQAGSQAEQLKARKNVRQRLKLQRSRRNRSRCSNCGPSREKVGALFLNLTKVAYVKLNDRKPPITVSDLL